MTKIRQIAEVVLLLAGVVAVSAAGYYILPIIGPFLEIMTGLCLIGMFLIAIYELLS